MMKFKQLREKYIEEASFSLSLIKKAVQIAKDMGGNMTGAYKKIERMKKGLGDHPDVENALRLANESVSEGTMAIGIKDRDPKERAKAQAQLSSMLKKDGNKKVGSKEGKKFDEVLDTYILSDDLLADEFANPKNKNMKIIDLLNKHAKRLRVDFSESLEEGFMKKMSQIQIKRKYGRVIKRALSKGSLELPADAEEALYMYAFDNGEIKTDDPDEFTDWLDNNLKDFVNEGIKTRNDGGAYNALRIAMYLSDQDGNPRWSRVPYGTSKSYLDTGMDMLKKDPKKAKEILSKPTPRSGSL